MNFLVVLIAVTLIGCSKQSSPPNKTTIDYQAPLTAQSMDVDFGLLDYKASALKTIQIVNDLSSPTTAPVSPVISEPNSSYYSIIYKNNCDKILKPAEKCIIKVQVSNTALSGNLNAALIADSLMINLTAQAKEVTPSFSFTVGGQNVTGIDFGSMSTEGVTKQVTVKNNAKVPYTVNPISLSSSDFTKSLDTCSGKSLAPNGTCKIMLLFSPQGKADQAYAATMTINDSQLSLAAVVSGGVSSNPTYDLSFIEKGIEVSAVDFGNVSRMVSRAIYIKNMGNSSIVNLNPVVVNNKFEIYYSSCSEVLAPGKSCSLRIGFEGTGKDSGNYSDTLQAGSASIALLAVNKPIIQSASLTGPVSRLFNDTYYTKEAFGVEIDAQVSATATGAGNNQLVVKYSLSDTCAGAVNKENLNLVPNQLNNIYLKVVDANNTSSDCMFLGKVVHDNILPAISYAQSSDLELNAQGASSNYSYSYSINELNDPVNYQVEMFASANCQGSSVSSVSKPYLAADSFVASVNVREYASIKVTASDKAGNSKSECSKSVTFGHPSSISVPSFATASKIYENPVTFSGSVKDQFSNKIAGISITIDSGVQNRIITTDSSGDFSFTVSSDGQYNSVSGVKINYASGSSAGVDAIVSSKPEIRTRGLMNIIRRSCQELAVYDQASTNGPYIVDVDLEEAASEFSIDCNFTTGIDFESVPASSIINRAKVTRSLKSLMGVERILMEGLSPATGESVVSGVNVFRLTNSDPRVRMVGSWSGMNSAPYGAYVVSDGNASDYVEFIFYGSGLNVLTPNAGSSLIDVRVSVDGAAETGVDIFPTILDILGNRRYAPNIVIPVVSGLPLKWHNVKLRRNFSGGVLWALSGFEVINERGNVLVQQGGAVNGGELMGIMTAQNLNYNQGITSSLGGRVVQYVKNNQLLSVATNITDPGELIINGNFSDGLNSWITNSTMLSYPEAGSVKLLRNGSSSGFYQTIPVVSGKTYKLEFKIRSVGAGIVGVEVSNSTGILGTVLAGSYSITSATSSSLVFTANSSVATIRFFGQATTTNYVLDDVSVKQFNVLENADHTNEEVAVNYPITTFGNGRVDDFTTVPTGGDNNAAFTLADGTTTLIAKFVRSLGDSIAIIEGTGHVTLTFIGTGLDIIRKENSTSPFNSTNISIDGSAPFVTNWGTGSLTSITKKVVSGLPYGTHTVKFARNGDTEELAFQNFIIYQPKKPTLPAGSKEVADYNVMANFKAPEVASVDHISQGVIRKANMRELSHIGSGWSVSGLAPVEHIGGIPTVTATSGNYLEYTFWGSGFDFRTRMNPSYSNNVSIIIDNNITNLSSYNVTTYGGVGLSQTVREPMTGQYYIRASNIEHWVRFNSGTWMFYWNGTHVGSSSTPTLTISGVKYDAESHQVTESGMMYYGISRSYTGNGAPYINAATGVVNLTGTALGGGIVVKDLPLGLHKVKIMNNTNAPLIMNALDIITPIHSYKSSSNP